MMASAFRRCALPLLAAMVLFVPVCAEAQSTPQVEIYGGLALTASDLGDSYEMFANGAMAEISLNLSDRLGLTGSFSFHGEKDEGFTTYFAQYYTLGGVRFSPRRGTVSPFITAVLGYTEVGDLSGVCGGVGGGVDVELSDLIALRAGADILPNRLGGETFVDFRVTAGVTFRIGELR